MAIVKLFRSRLVPGGVAAGASEAQAGLAAALSRVPDLSHYELLSEAVSLVQATTRSSWALSHETIALKVSSAELHFLPAPRPWTEVFVWSTSIEGIHLRFGALRPGRDPLERAALRPASRSPGTGAGAGQEEQPDSAHGRAKGAFALRSEALPFSEALGQGAQAGQVAYSVFISALLDVTDNLVGGAVVHPAGVPCLDGDDPYLVVAPDKGTAAFSDLANALSAKRNFWLGDAFASGGSRGYDHKALGITARGAWGAVQRHFRALGMDAQRDELRVVGVGDMSGDVFGNAMLQSRAVRLVAAFDHRHIFVDPSPVAPASFAERDPAEPSPRIFLGGLRHGRGFPGAAVFSRQAKSIELSPEAAKALSAQPARCRLRSL